MQIAGVLASAWPCGIIVMISELFRAESKSQVYASLHQYLSDYPSVLDKLGTYNHVHVLWLDLYSRGISTASLNY